MTSSITTSSTPAPALVVEPFAISRIADRYLLFDVDIIAHCRRAHNICGMLIGTIPNLSQQNVFLGVPLELMPEEARVLVEKGAAYIVDDVEAHHNKFVEMSREDRLRYLAEMDRRGTAVAKDHEEKSEARKDKALKKKGLRRDVLDARREASVLESSSPIEKGQPPVSNAGLGLIMKGSAFSDTSASSITSSSSSQKASSTASSISSPGLGFILKGSAFVDAPVKASLPTTTDKKTDGALFDSAPVPPSPTLSSRAPKSTGIQKHYVTPTMSYPPMATPPPDASTPLPNVPVSYPLFKYLHSKGFFHMPGLRFGCHYNVYPGDPLRYHSHFAATGLGWDQEFDMLDVVGGGRLGTGTKKAYMIGGEDPALAKIEDKQSARAFSIEWAAL